MDLVRLRAVARPWLGDEVYAFRTHCAACKEGERDKLHVVHATLSMALRNKLDPHLSRGGSAPRWELGTTTLPLDRGRGGRTSVALASTFQPGLGRTRLVIDVQRGRRETHASATLFLIEPEPGDFFF